MRDGRRSGSTPVLRRRATWISGYFRLTRRPFSLSWHTPLRGSGLRSSLSSKPSSPLSISADLSSPLFAVEAVNRWNILPKAHQRESTLTPPGQAPDSPPRPPPPPSARPSLRGGKAGGGGKEIYRG